MFLNLWDDFKVDKPFLFSQSVNSYVFLPKNYDFRVFIIRLLSFLLPITSNKGAIKVKFHFARLTSKNSHVFLPYNFTIFESS